MGLVSAVIIENADRSATAIRDALDAGAPLRDTLVGYATGLLKSAVDRFIALYDATD